MVVSIFIAGGSCSGKTELARALWSALGADRALILQEDNYFHDRPSNDEQANRGANLDTPAAKDQALLSEHIVMLRDGRAIPKIEFDFKQRRRLAISGALDARDFLIVEGMHVLAEERLRASADLKVFVDAPEFLRLARRVVRDSVERARTIDFITEQFLGPVRLGHNQTVEPQRQWADVVIDGGIGYGVSPRPSQPVFTAEASAILTRVGA